MIYELWVGIERQPEKGEYSNVGEPMPCGTFDTLKQAEKAQNQIHDWSESNQQITEEQADKLITLLWGALAKDPDHQHRKQTGYGSKTKVGLVACIQRILFEGD
jgi:hypothetical protein